MVSGTVTAAIGISYLSSLSITLSQGDVSVFFGRPAFAFRCQHMESGNDPRPRFSGRNDLVDKPSFRRFIRGCELGNILAGFEFYLRILAKK